MSFRLIFFGLFYFVAAGYAYHYHWELVLIIPMAVINGWINSTPFDKRSVGKLWHGLQLGILFAIAGVMVWLKVIAWEEIVLVIALYHSTFEISRNLFENQEWDYVGETANTDQWIRAKFRTLGLRRTFFITSKVIFIFAGFAIFMFSK